MRHRGKYCVFIFVSFLLTSCVMENELDPDDKFGLIDRNDIKNWSALWHMSQTGSIKFCIRNYRDQSELNTVKNAAIYSVNSWVEIMNRTSPNSSYTDWNRSRIQTNFGCSGAYYAIDLFYGRSNCPYAEKRINLGHDQGRWVLAHEFGHSMGLADTYSYSSGGGALPGQPRSMMQDGNFTEDDYYGLWSLWNFINTGVVRCGPGYVPSRDYNGWGDAMCEPGDDNTSCEYPCSSEGECYDGRWLCTDGCWENVGDCNSSSTCEYNCSDYGYSEGQCRSNWLCTDGCLSYGCDTSSTCEYRCSDYGYSEGQCYANWRCTDGCLHYGC